MQYSYAWVTRSCLFLKFFLIHKHESRSYSDSRKCTLKKIRFLLSRYRFVCVFFFLFFFCFFCFLFLLLHQEHGVVCLLKIFRVRDRENIFDFLYSIFGITNWFVFLGGPKKLSCFIHHLDQPPRLRSRISAF